MTDFSEKVLHAYEILRKDGFSGLWRVGNRKLVRIMGGGLWNGYRDEALLLSKLYDYSSADLQRSREVHQKYSGELEIRTATWFLPDFHNPFYGGIYTILRYANFLYTMHGVQLTFVVIGSMAEEEIAALIERGFPEMRGAVVRKIRNSEEVQSLPESDIAIATLWSTAYYLLHYNQTKRKFYFIQDFEPLFYPAGSIQAQVESTYRFGYYGLTNTPTLRDIYVSQYGGEAEFFYPCVDLHRFFPAPVSQQTGTFKVFFYGRPDHPRNGFEMGIEALRILKRKMGSEVEIFSAGAEWIPSDYSLRGVVNNLGILSLDETANLYRTCDAGLILMFTRHPSYIPFELMASGCLVVTNFNPSTIWFLRDEENCLLASTSSACLAERLEYGLRNQVKRQEIIASARQEILSHYQDWNTQLHKIYTYMKAPKILDEDEKEAK